MRKGVVTSTNMFWALIIVMIFVGFMTAVTISQKLVGGPNTLTEFGGGTGGKLNTQIRSTAEMRSSSSLSNQVLRQDYNGRPFIDVLQDYMYCRATGGSCEVSESDVRDAVDRVMPKGGYQMTISYQGETVEVSSAGFSGQPDEYQLLLPMPGGTVAKLRILVGGSEEVMTWER